MTTRSMITETDELFEAFVEQLEGRVLSAEWTVEQLQESIADATRTLARDDLGWSPLTGSTTDTMAVDDLRDLAKRARVQALFDPLIRRGLAIMRTYCWSGGVQISARKDDTGQDVNTVLQTFLDDQAATFTSAQARHEMFDALATDGNLFLALPTNPLTGRVQVRTVPMGEIGTILTNPEDADETWLFKRTRTVRKINITTNSAGAQSTATVTENVTTWHPALGFRPTVRPKTVDGVPVDWDTPVLHATVNRPTGSLWGTPDLVAALPWSRGYRDFLTDWASLMRSLSKIAFKATGTPGTKTGQVRAQIGAATEAGGTAVLGPGQNIEAISKSGATIDSGSGRPLAAMVAAAMNVPVTMLLSDPGVTGARATAETLDRPLTEAVGARRELIAAYTRRVLDHVIDQAIKAPRGALNGTVTIDPGTDREVITLAGDQDRSVDLDWPLLVQVGAKEQLEAIQIADDMGALPPEVMARLALVALDVENVDEVIASQTDDDGQWIDPKASTAQAAGAAALQAWRDGKTSESALG